MVDIHRARRRSVAPDGVATCGAVSMNFALHSETAGGGPSPAPAPGLLLPGAADITPMKGEMWIRACYDTLYGAGDAVLIETRGAVAPLARRGRVLPILVLAGAEELFESSEPAAVDAEAARGLAEAILERRRPVRFGHVPADGVFAPAFIAAARGPGSKRGPKRGPKRGIVFAEPAGGSPVLKVPQGTDPLTLLSSRRRSDLRRMRRRAEEIGPVAVEMRTPAPEEVAGLLDRAFAIEASGWKGRRHTAVTQNPVQTRFFYRYFTLAAAAGQCRIAFLTIGGETAAMQVMIEDDRALWLFKIGYDEHFARVSPGTLLFTEVIRQAAAEGLDRVEFLGQDTPWTALWETTLKRNIKLRYYPRTALGLATLARDGAMVTARRTWRRWSGRG